MIHYDDENDVLFVGFSDAQPDGCEEVVPGVDLEFSAAGELTGIHFLPASGVLGRADLEIIKAGAGATGDGPEAKRAGDMARLVAEHDRQRLARVA